MSSIDVEMPPGVLRTTSSASACSDSARATSVAMYAAVMLLMSPVRSAWTT